MSDALSLFPILCGLTGCIFCVSPQPLSCTSGPAPLPVYACAFESYCMCTGKLAPLRTNNARGREGGGGNATQTAQNTLVFDGG